MSMRCGVSTIIFFQGIICVGQSAAHVILLIDGGIIFEPAIPTVDSAGLFRWMVSASCFLFKGQYTRSGPAIGSVTI